MDKIKALKLRLEGLWDRAELIRSTATTERRDLTEAEVAELNGYLDDIDKTKTQLETEERAVRAREALNAISQQPPPRPETPAQRASRREPQDGDAEPLPKWTSLGEQLIAVRNAAMPGGRVDPRLTIRAATGLNETVPADGGFLVDKDFTNQLLRRTYEVGMLASRVRKIPISAGSNGLKMNAVDETSRANGARWGGVQAYWQAEAETKVASKPKFRQMEMTLKKLIGLCYATDELLEDAAALEAVIRDAFTEEFAFKIDDAILWGPGGGQPLGIMLSPALITVPAVGGQTADLLYENITAMWARLWARSRPNAVWLMNQGLEPALFGMTMTTGTGTAGVPVFLPPNGAVGAPNGTIFGRPIISLEQSEASGTLGDILLIDPTQYLMIDKGGMQTATSIHVRFVNDETAFRFVLRVDGMPIWNSPITPYKGTDTLSPYVALAAR